MTTSVPVPSAARRRVFLSYRHYRPGGTDVDERLAGLIEAALAERHDVFMDRTIAPGENWVKRIEEELRRADVLVSLLSAESVTSEMVLGEIEKACRRKKPPMLLPVRICYAEAYPYALKKFLDPIQWISWNSEADTPKLIERIIAAVDRGSASRRTQAQPKVEPSPAPGIEAPHPVAPLDFESGTIDQGSRFYVERVTDAMGRAAMSRNGVTVVIKGPRQIGKSSLFVRLLNEARKRNKAVAKLDFELLDEQSLSNSDLFLRSICSWISAKLAIPDAVDQYWRSTLPPSVRFTNYLQHHVLAGDRQVVIAIDEADRVADCSFASDFYGMLRACHNERADDPLWKRLDLVLVASTEPYHLIRNPSQSPFNIGELLRLSEFTLPQVHDLNGRHGSPLTREECAALHQLVGGHPYLIRRGLYLIATGSLTTAELCSSAHLESGPFGDHLRYHLLRLHSRPELWRAFAEILNGGTTPDKFAATHLQGAGLVRVDGRVLRAACKVYADYFGTQLQ